MTKPKPPKKSETLEVRLPHVTKMAFMDQCRADGRTASDAVRSFIEQELRHSDHPPPRPRAGWWQALAAAAGGLAIGAVAAPSLAHPAPESRATFDARDQNHDGVLSLDEFLGD